MHPRFRRIAVISVVMYGLLCLLLVVGSSSDWLPRWIAYILVTIIGPGMFLVVGGFDALWLFAIAIFLILACLAWAHWLWRQFPADEWFVLPLLASLGLWPASGWLAVGIATV